MAAASAASAAAASAAAEAVVSALTRAYNVPLRPRGEEPHLPEEPPGGEEELSSKLCMMDKNWDCGNRAVKGEKGWHYSKSGGWRKVCQQCNKQLETQQSGHMSTDQRGWDSD